MSKPILPPEKSMFIPKYWLSDHSSIGKMFKVPGDDEIYFIALKSPLSERINSLFPENKRWGPKETMKKIDEMIDKSSISKWIFYAIELGNEVNPPNDEWDRLNIEHFYCPISRDYLRQEIDSFINLITSNNRKSYHNLFIVSCNDGHDRCGVAISMFLMRSYDLELSVAYNLFKQHREPGIYSKSAIKFLSMYKSKNDQETITNTKRDNEFEIQNIHDEDINLKIDRLPNFRHFGCDPVTRNRDIESYNSLFSRSASKDSFTHSPDYDSPKPIIEYLEFNQISSNTFDDNNQTLSLTPECLNEIQNKVYRCSFVPSGIFVYLLAIEPNYLIVNYGFNNYWSIPSHLKCKLPLICTAYAIETSSHIEFFITDLLQYQTETFEKMDLDDRIAMIYFDILPNLILSKRAHVTLRYRPMGRMTELVKLYEFLNSKDYKDRYNFQTDGLAFIQRKWAPGKFIYVPINIYAHLLFLMNATDIAILYARSDDNKTIIPVKYFKFTKKEKLGGLHEKVIKFNIVEPNNPNSKWKPIAICKNRSPDYFSYVKAMLKSAINEKNESELLKTIEDTVKKGIEEQKKTKNKPKPKK